jgi:hypothetical protein
MAFSGSIAKDLGDFAPNFKLMVISYISHGLCEFESAPPLPEL